MSYNTEYLNTAKAILTERRANADAQANARLSEVYKKLPDIREIDLAFAGIGQKIISAFAEGGNVKEKIDALHKESDELTKVRADALESISLPSDYTSPRYMCKKCNDTGYIHFKMCSCLKRELVKIGYKNSGLGALLEKQSFDNFSLNYYTGADRETMQANYQICKNYADTFGENSGSIFMIGGTGLGKTHLSTSIAATVIEKGYDVQYVTAQNLISDFSFERYRKSFSDSSPSTTDKYFECDLLIIDDFGTEENNQFSNAVFYNLINSRVNASKKTIINTNVHRNSIAERYTDRVASRLFGEYTVLFFPGKDIRMQKLMQ